MCMTLDVVSVYYITILDVEQNMVWIAIFYVIEKYYGV